MICDPVLGPGSEDLAPARRRAQRAGRRTQVAGRTRYSEGRAARAAQDTPHPHIVPGASQLTSQPPAMNLMKPDGSFRSYRDRNDRETKARTMKGSGAPVPPGR
jgi:hypothetical protein